MNQNRFVSLLPGSIKQGFSFLTGKKREDKKQAPAAPVPPPDLEIQKARLRAYSSLCHSTFGQLLLEEKWRMLDRLYKLPRIAPGIDSTALLIHSATIDGRVQELEALIDDLNSADTKLAELEAKYPTVLKPKENNL